MGHRQRLLMTNGLAVDGDRRLNMGTFQEEHDVAVLPRLRHRDATLVPGTACIVALGGQEEGKLHLSGLAVLLHIGIEIEAGVIERACPAGINGNDVTLAICQHGTWQQDGALLALRAELPRTAKINGTHVGGMNQQAATCHQRKHCQNQSFHLFVSSD